MKAIDAANFLVYLLKDDEDGITNMKLNKLLYFAQGHALKERGKPLFDENIEAWQYGPVVSSVYHAFKNNKNHPISDYSGAFDYSSISRSDQEFLINIALQYGCYTGSTLMNITHKIGSPWASVYKPGSRNTIIPKDLIHQYFDSNVEKIEEPNFNFSPDDYVGYRNDEGYLVLPREYDEA